MTKKYNIIYETSKVALKNRTPFNGSIFMPYSYEYSALNTFISVCSLFVFTHKMQFYRRVFLLCHLYGKC